MKGKNQHIIITGTTKGLGNCLCRQLLNEGYTVTGFARSENLEEFQLKELERMYKHVTADLSILENVDLVYSEIINKKSQYLIINAADYSLAENMTQEKFQQQMNLNLLFPALLIQKIVSARWKTPLKIIFISSIMAEIYDAKTPMYGAAKVAVSHFIGGLQLQEYLGITFLKVTAGPMSFQEDLTPFSKKISSSSFEKAAVSIVQNLDSTRTEIFVPRIWRYVLWIKKVMGVKVFSRFMNSKR